MRYRIGSSTGSNCSSPELPRTQRNPEHSWRSRMALLARGLASAGHASYACTRCVPCTGQQQHCSAFSWARRLCNAGGGYLSAFRTGNCNYRKLHHRDAEKFAASTAHWPFHAFAAMAIYIMFAESADERFLHFDTRRNRRCCTETTRPKHCSAAHIYVCRSRTATCT